MPPGGLIQSTDLGFSDKYATPAILWDEALPDQITPSDFSPGTVSAPILTGTSAGTIRVSELPRDAYPIRLKITYGGQVGVARFKCSSDNGVTFFDAEFLTSVDPIDIRDSEGRKTGLLVSFANHATVNPSFILNDYWSITTTGSPDLNRKLISVSADIDSIVGHNTEQGRYHLPLKSWPYSWAKNVAYIVALELLEKRGFDLTGRDKLYKDRGDRAQQWFNDIAHFKIHPNVTDQGQEVWTPDLRLGPDKFRIIRKNYTP